ncbi:MAG TPA: LuxR C-terminal-related transcriptional regulator [Gemmatimonadales bacterium]|nr:LuxR C-terminal-related transcriptional regulator [Gemmatimonadales bacterium]
MDKNSPDTNGGRPVSPLVPSDKLAELLTSFSHLRNNNQALVQTLHGSIHELRELRSSLQKQHAIGLSPGTNGKQDRSLAARFGLTRREVEVATLLAQGRSNQAIARQLKISAHTARHHTQRILSKLEVHSRGEAGAKIRRS